MRSASVFVLAPILALLFFAFLVIHFQLENGNYSYQSSSLHQNKINRANYAQTGSKYIGIFCVERSGSTW